MNTPYVTGARGGQSLRSQQLMLPPRATIQIYWTQPTCELCQTDESTVCERVPAVGKRTTGDFIFWDVDCWCGKCATFYGFRTMHPSDGLGMDRGILGRS